MRRLRLLLQFGCGVLLLAAWLLAARAASLLQGFQTLPVIALAAAASILAIAAGALAWLQRAPDRPPPGTPSAGTPPFGD